MNLRFIETFVCVAKLKSFRMAGERLNASQAAISNRIATLEKELGVRLFERDLRGVFLTPIGQEALPKAEALLGHATDFFQSFASPEAKVGSVSLGCIDPIAYSWLTSFTSACMVDYPGVTLNLTLDSSLNLKKMLLAGEIELAMMMGPILDDKLINVGLFEFKCVWVRSARFGPSENPLSIAEVAKQPILAYSRNSPPDQAIRQALHDAGIGNSRVINSSSFATAIKLAVDGLGCGSLPREIVQPYIDSGDLAQFNCNLPNVTLQCHAVFPAEFTHRLPGILAQMARRQAAAYFQEQVD